MDPASPGTAIFATFGLVLGLALYFVPAMVAASRGRAVGPVSLVNLFFGWTVLGWFGALIWAVTERTAREERAHRARLRDRRPA